MVERDQRRDEILQDADAWKEACAVFGDEGALSRLRTFRRELAEHLASIGRGQRDPEALRQMAHRTAGRAGLFGFRALAEASVGLDEAARWNRDIAAALDLWTEQARRAAATGSDERTSPSRE